MRRSTSAFNFVDPNGEALPSLPATSRHAADGLRQRQEQLPQVPLPSPVHQRLPHQRRLARPSRALPYQLHVEATVEAEQRRVTLNLFNTGEQGAVFHVYDRRDLAQIPRRFTVEAGKAVSDDWQTEDEYHLWLLGPNGFHRELRGALNRPQPEVRLRPTGRSLQLQLNNPGTEAIAVTLERCPYTQQGRGTSRCRRAAVTNRGLTPAPAAVGMTLRCKAREVGCAAWRAGWRMASTASATR